MKFKHTPLLFLLFFFSQIVEAQRLAHNDMLLFSLQKNAEGSIALSAPRFLTAFNPRGYNNQPYFFSPTEVFLTAQFPDDTTQTDVVSLDLASQTQTRVTRTREAEYSPTPMPGGKRFSCIRVEADGAQRLWSFPLDRSDAGRVVFPKITGVGYHCWLNDTLAALFIVGENGGAHSLVLAGLKGQKPQKIATNIGRSLHRLPDGRLAFVQKATDQTWFLKTYDLKKQSSEIVVVVPPGSEDFAVLPDGSFVMGSKDRLLHYRPGLDQSWREIAHLNIYGVKNVTRLAVSGRERLVAVVQ